MLVQVNTDDAFRGDLELIREVEATVTSAIERYQTQITRVEVYLSDTNAEKAGSGDKRCLIEVRVAGRRPEAVSHAAPTIADAYAEATRKLQRALDTTLGKRADVKGGDTLRGRMP